MLELLKSLFGDHRADAPANAETDVDPLALAAAGLLVEAAQLDDNFADAERRAIQRILTRDLHVDEQAAEELISAATADDRGLYAITRTIRDRLEPEERYRILEMLWEVAYADGALDDYEANLARRVAGLLYVSDQDSGAARRRVIERLGLNPDDAEAPK